MTLTEEQRDAIRAISKLPMAIGCQLCHPYIMKNYGSHFIVLRAMTDSSGTVGPTGGFDLEKARAADEALPYPLDAKEIWVSGKGQMHINPPNAPSVFFTLSDLCKFRNLFHGQAAEIERLLASLVEHEEHENQTHAILGAILGTDDTLENVAKRAMARIAELEDALAEGLTNFLHYRASCYDPARRCPYAKECDDCSTWDACGHVEMFRSEARQRLQADGKIGPGDGA